MWEESYGGHQDSKPKGPTAVAVDFTFAGMYPRILKEQQFEFSISGTDNVYGLPQHADTFSLKDTTSTDPYRLYNLGLYIFNRGILSVILFNCNILDVFEYELWNPMALYASIPMMVSITKTWQIIFSIVSLVYFNDAFLSR